MRCLAENKRGEPCSYGTYTPWSILYMEQNDGKIKPPNYRRDRWLPTWCYLKSAFKDALLKNTFLLHLQRCPRFHRLFSFKYINLFETDNLRRRSGCQQIGNIRQILTFLTDRVGSRWVLTEEWCQVGKEGNRRTSQGRSYDFRGQATGTDRGRGASGGGWGRQQRETHSPLLCFRLTSNPCPCLSAPSPTVRLDGEEFAGHLQDATAAWLP